MNRLTKNLMMIILLAIMLVITVGYASAVATQLVPVDISQSIIFDSPTSMHIVMPNGFEKYFTWNASTQPADSTFTHTVYYPLNGSWCSYYDEVAFVMDGMVDQCQNAINNTQSLVREASEAKSDRQIYENMYMICEDNRKEAVNKSNILVSSLNECSTKRDDYMGTATSLQSKAGELTTCEKDLDDALKSKTSYGIIWALLGLGAGYMMWRRNRGSFGPSEQAESGMVTDHVYHRPQAQPHTFQGFEDGPKK